MKPAGPNCFAAGTPLLTPTGSKAVEELRPGDLVLSRSEFDENAPIEARQVEEVFVQVALLRTLCVAGGEIRTTEEHPFYVRDKGWVKAAFLEVGDLLLSHDGRWIALDALPDTRRVATVYNVRVAENHTYFVGNPETWGFSVWAHNACFFHGTSAVKAAAILARGPNLAASEANLDFGRGFYTTTSEAQAEAWGEVVVRFDVPDAALAALKVEDFGLTVTVAWQTTVWKGRNGILDTDPLRFDMVRGLYLTNTGAVTQNGASAWNLRGRPDQQAWLTAAAIAVLMTNRPEIVP